MIKRFGGFLKRLHADTSGKMSVEMILLLALIALPIIIILMLFKTQVYNWFHGQVGQLNDPGQAPAP